MKHRVLVFVLALFADGSWAQEDLLACVDPGVREGLLFRTPESGAFLSRTVPDDLAGLPDAEELEFIGSSVSSFLTVAAYKAELAPVDAMSIAAGLLREAGWRDFQMRMPSGGFVTGNEPRIDTFCRDDSMLDVVGSVSGDTTYVRLQVRPTIEWIDCDASEGTLPGLVARMRGRATLHEHVPTLLIPAGAAPLETGASLMASPLGFSGTDRTAGAETELQTALSAQELAEEFGRQLEAQGWVYDTAWSGEYASGSGWTRSPTEELELTGLLDVIALGGSGYRASFRLSARDSD